MNPLFEMVVVPALGFAIANNQTHIDHLIDDAADKTIAAVMDSNTKIDNVAADALASALERFAARVKAGVTV